MLFHIIFYWILDKLTNRVKTSPKMPEDEIAAARLKLIDNGSTEAEADALIAELKKSGII